jgi:hypothetical protein
MKKRTLFLALTVFFTLFSCGTRDVDGIFKDIEKEIELDDAVAKGNFFDIVAAGGKLYAGAGKVYVKDNPGAKRGWQVFSDCPLSGGVVVRLAVSGTTMTVECAEGGNRGYFYTTSTSGPNWTSAPAGTSIALPRADSVPDRAITCSCKGPGNATYHGTPAGAYSLNNGTWAQLPGSNISAAIGNYYISAIYYDTSGAIYVGTIGSGTTYGTKNNGIWAYYPNSNEWNRE